jgi:hypothetical protein
MKSPDRPREKDLATNDEAKSIFGLVALIILGVLAGAAVAMFFL